MQIHYIEQKHFISLLTDIVKRRILELLKEVEELEIQAKLHNIPTWNRKRLNIARTRLKENEDFLKEIFDYQLIQ